MKVITLLAWILWMQHPSGSWSPLSGYEELITCQHIQATMGKERVKTDGILACFPSHFDPRETLQADFRFMGRAIHVKG